MADQPPSPQPARTRPPRRSRPRPPTAEEALVARLPQLLDPTRLRTSEHTFLLVLAGLVGVYGGLAVGLFSNTIAVLRILFFRTREVADFLEGDPALRERFWSLMGATRWHPELLVLGLVAAVAATIYGMVLRRRRQSNWGERIVTIAVVGGAGLLIFYSMLLLGAFERTFLHIEGGLLELLSDTPWPLVLLAPALGGLAVGVLIERYSPESRGHGVAEVLESIAVHHSRIPARTAVFKGLTAAFTMASGGSVGREGPVVQIGSAVGSSIGQRLGVSRSQLRMLVGCGAAAGIAAAFDAPIAGAMFALEVILADFGVATFSPIVLSSVIATVVARAITTQERLTEATIAGDTIAGVPHREITQTGYRLVSAFEIGPYLVLGLICGIIALVFIAWLDRADGLFKGKWGGWLGRNLAALPGWARPAVGGLGVGLIGLAVPQALGAGYEAMNATLNEQYGVGLVLAALVGKLAATSLTLGSGGSGGSFFPSLFLGAMTGSAFGSLVHALFPLSSATSGAYSLVGMGAVVAGAVQGPLTGIIMMFELTGDYQIILPLMISCLSASLLVNRWLGYSMYTLKLAHKGIDPRGSRGLDMLRHVPVSDVMKREAAVVPNTMRFRALVEQLTRSRFSSHAVVDAKGRYVGLVSLEEVRGFVFEAGLDDLVLAGDIARTDIAPLSEDEDLQNALERIAALEFDHVPVVSRDDSKRVVGMLSRRDVLVAYRNLQADADRT